LHKK
jgi:hypothetical protein